MCGIVGFCGDGGYDTLKKMASALWYRGPDNEGFYFNTTSRVALGHRRLSIIDLEGSNQPIFNEDNKICVICNGEIYNYKELRDELIQKKHIFKTNGDTEVILHGYEEYAERIVDKLNGMFVFAIYDQKQNRILLVRDRMGKKPLYYYLNEDTGTLIFSSELKALLKHPAIPNKTDISGIYKYFAYGYIPAPLSIIQSVRKLPASHFLLFDLIKRVSHVEKYWEISYSPKLELSQVECQEKIRLLLSEAVKRRLMSDVPLGIFLSGGIDSSTIASFAVENHSSQKVKTFSISFEEKTFDESRYSRQVASVLGTEHFEERFSIKALLSILPEILKKLDEPMADASILPTYLLSKFTRKTVKVVLGGDGGDELFAGYDPFLAQRFARYLDILFRPTFFKYPRRLVDMLPASEKNLNLDFILKRFLMGMQYPNQLRHNIWMSTLDPQELNSVFQKKLSLENLYKEAGDYAQICQNEEENDGLIHTWIRTYLQDDILTKLDRATMAVSLEARCPFLDQEFVEFVAKIPSRFKYRKYILKKAMRKILPRNIIYRKKKGFGIPLAKWLKGELRELLDEYTSPARTRQWGMDARVVNQLKQEHLTGKQDNRLFLWALIVLSFWKENINN
jgi:asparagine synthase (glutamine-hydrolysing)